MNTATTVTRDRIIKMLSLPTLEEMQQPARWDQLALVCIGMVVAGHDPHQVNLALGITTYRHADLMGFAIRLRRADNGYRARYEMMTSFLLHRDERREQRENRRTVAQGDGATGQTPGRSLAGTTYRSALRASDAQHTPARGQAQGL